MPVTNAAPNQVKLPPEKATLRFSKLPGYTLATQKCLICHSADYISYQAPDMNQAKWTAEVNKMQHTYGASLSEDEIKSIGAYLAVAYGTAKASDASIIAVSTALEPVAGISKTGVAIDIQGLLNNNACLGCHAIDKKMVGPAFREVASKYKGDAQAQSKLAASIQKGSVGKWCQVPMPPMTSLNELQANALADFVLKQ